MVRERLALGLLNEVIVGSFDLRESDAGKAQCHEALTSAGAFNKKLILRQARHLQCFAVMSPAQHSFQGRGPLDKLPRS